MIKINPKESIILKNILDRKNAVEELLDKQFAKHTKVNNKDLLYEIITEYTKLNRAVELWWSRISTKYDFDNTVSHNLNFNTNIIT